MTYLLDTNVFLWLRMSPDRVRPAVRERLAEARTSLTLSAASCWEIAFKQANGGLPLPGPARTWLPQALDELHCDVLSLGFDHAIEAALLPLHHRDPFDRFLIAQARVEGLTLVTSDKALSRYEVEILRA